MAVAVVAAAAAWCGVLMVGFEYVVWRRVEFGLFLLVWVNFGRERLNNTIVWEVPRYPSNQTCHDVCGVIFFLEDLGVCVCGCERKISYDRCTDDIFCDFRNKTQKRGGAGCRLVSPTHIRPKQTRIIVRAPSRLKNYILSPPAPPAPISTNIHELWQ